MSTPLPWYRLSVPGALWARTSCFGVGEISTEPTAALPCTQEAARAGTVYRGRGRSQGLCLIPKSRSVHGPCPPLPAGSQLAATAPGAWGGWEGALDLPASQMFINGLLRTPLMGACECVSQEGRARCQSHWPWSECDQRPSPLVWERGRPLRVLLQTRAEPPVSGATFGGTVLPLNHGTSRFRPSGQSSPHCQGPEPSR